MTTERPIVAEGIARVGPGSQMPYSGWRPGPTTPDGHWMVMEYPRKLVGGGTAIWAVRVVVDPLAEKVDPIECGTVLERALHAPRHQREDSYLSALAVVSMLPPDDLTLLRDAVLAGRTGGAADGAPRKRTRKVAAA